MPVVMNYSHQGSRGSRARFFPVPLPEAAQLMCLISAGPRAKRPSPLHRADKAEHLTRVAVWVFA